MPNMSSYNSDIVKTIEPVLTISDIKVLNGQLPIGCELEELSPGAYFCNLFFSSGFKITLFCMF